MVSLMYYGWFVFWLGMAGGVIMAGILVIGKVREYLKIRAIRKWAKRCRKANEGCL